MDWWSQSFLKFLIIITVLEEFGGLLRADVVGEVQEVALVQLVGHPGGRGVRGGCLASEDGV